MSRHVAGPHPGANAEAVRALMRRRASEQTPPREHAEFPAGVPAREPATPDAAPDGDAGAVLSGALSDDALALAFAAAHADRLRYVADVGRWRRYEAGCWRDDAKLGVYDAARAQLRRTVAAERLTEREAAALRSAKTVNAVVTLARSDRRLVSEAAQYDRDPWQLNTPGGVVDLRTGQLTPHDPAQYHSQQTAATPDDAAPCPRWRAFLAQCTGGDAALERFLQKVAGYALTGSIREHALFFLYGTGGNGKGVFLNTLHRVLGTYADVAPIETFTESKGERHPTELAALRGRRLVIAQETEEGRRWAEARLKALTGGDAISARVMRGDFFTFQPQFKLVIAGNHRPHLRGVDDAMRRRLHLVPFAHQVPAAERDADLPAKLEAEWPGILAWAVEGCALWLEEELRPPAAVQAATADYFSAEDGFAAWLDECCDCVPGAWASGADLFASWSAYAERGGEHAGSAKRLTQKLEAAGFTPVRRHGGTRGFAGLAIRPVFTELRRVS